MSSLLFQNAHRSQQRGGGLPFFRYKNYQWRYRQQAMPTPTGLWTVPRGYYPTFQLWTNDPLDALELVPVDGLADGVPIPVNVASPKMPLQTRCADDANAVRSNIIWVADDLGDLIPCGLYYYRLTAGEEVFYSEIFAIAPELDACACEFSAALTSGCGEDFCIAYSACAGSTVSVSVSAPPSITVLVDNPAPGTISIISNTNDDNFADFVFTITPPSPCPPVTARYRFSYNTTVLPAVTSLTPTL